MIDALRKQLAEAIPLSPEQISQAVVLLLDATVPDQSKADFLGDLARKGETPQEIATFARELRDRSIPLPLDADTRSREILDVCGTGGDRLNTFNISTTVAIICAAAGVTVAKHGNRAVTSLAGSADVLETLGIRIELTPQEASQRLREHQFAFLFAPHYHPAFKQLGAARKICAGSGKRTIFNFLGPLLNPALPSAQLVGVSRPELCEPIAQVLQLLGVRRGMVASGQVGEAWLDELSTLGDTTIAEFYQDRGFTCGLLSREHYPIRECTLADLAGGDRKANAEIVYRLLINEDQGPKRDAVLFNASAALFVAGRTKSMVEGWELADKLLVNGETRKKLLLLQAA